MKALALLLVMGLVGFAIAGCGGGGGSNCLPQCSHCETSIECCNNNSNQCVLFVDGSHRCAIPGVTICP
jgi:hypothetical protein